MNSPNHELLSWLEGVVRSSTQLEQFAAQVVASLRNRDVEWQMIGEAMGITAVDAERRFGA